MGTVFDKTTGCQAARCIIAALLASVFAGVPAASAETAQNAFVSVTASGVRRDNGRDFSATGDVAHIVANPGWRLRTPPEVRLDVGAPAVYRVGDLLGENDADGHIDVIRTETEDVHVALPVISAKTSCGGPFIIAYPASNKTVSVSFSASIDKAGLHSVTTRTYKNGEREKTEGPEDVAMSPDVWKWEWTAGPHSGSSDKQSFSTNLVFTPGTYEISGTVKAKCDSCGECAAIASAETNLLVSLLKVECNPWIGQDRTGDPASPYKSPKVVAAASLSPSVPGVQGVEWEYEGDRTCDEFHPDAWAATLWSTSRDAHSKTFLGDQLRATVLGTSAATNFTVVAVDVTIDGVNEEKEEPEGALVKYVPDAANRQWTMEGSNSLASVSVNCRPELATNEVLTIAAPGKSFFICHNGKYYELPQGYDLPVHYIRYLRFALHGHEESNSFADKDIRIEHAKSGAVDVARFAGVKLRVANIKFNHDVNSSESDAINIRRSFSFPIDVSNGEWIAGNGVAVNEPCCYTTNREVTVKAKFEASNFITTAVIRAECLGGGGSLSSLLPANVVFSEGVSPYVEFKMANKTLCAIDRSDDGVLQWAADGVNASASGCSMNASGPHLVYTILCEPRTPWTNNYDKNENAWTNALEFAIVKAGAQGKTSDKDALAAITTYLHGEHGLRYDTVLGRARFIDGPGGGSMRLDDYIKSSADRSTSLVNCYDQAGGICSLGALLGIDARYVYMRPFGYINAVDIVGVGRCNNPFFGDKSCQYGTTAVVGSDLTYPLRSAFGNHSFSMLSNRVFDSCAGPVCGIDEQIYKQNTIDVSTLDEAAAAAGGKVYNIGECCISQSGIIIGVLGVTELK